MKRDKDQEREYKALLQRCKELEAVLMFKEMQANIYEAIIKEASEELNIDIKKHFASKVEEKK